MELGLKSEVAGYYRIEAFKTDANGIEIDGTRRVAADWFDNLITDAGLNFMGTGLGINAVVNGGLLYACAVGSGSTSPAVTDTTLVAEVARTTTRQADVNGAQGSAPYYGWRRITYRFGTGAAAGNLSEVGIFTTSPTGGTCVSRALIVDGLGSPTTITVLSDETLDVIYEFRLYPPVATDTAWAATISSVNYSGVVRACNVTNTVYGGNWAIGNISTADAGVMLHNGVGNNYCYAFATQTLGAITTQPAGTAAQATSLTASAYISGSYQRQHQLIWDLNQGNTGSGIGSFRLMTMFGAYQLSVTPVLPKDSTKRLTLNVMVSWGRYTP